MLRTDGRSLALSESEGLTSWSTGSMHDTATPGHEWLPLPGLRPGGDSSAPACARRYHGVGHTRTEADGDRELTAVGRSTGWRVEGRRARTCGESRYWDGQGSKPLRRKAGQ